MMAHGDLGTVCAHGSLQRQCRECELEADLAERDQRIERLASEMAEMTHDAQPEAEADWLALAAVLHDAADALEREDQ